MEIFCILSLTIFIRVRTNSCCSFMLSSFPVYVTSFSVAGLTPNSKSPGSFISVPKITFTGDLDVESWTADWYARQASDVFVLVFLLLAHYFPQVLPFRLTVGEAVWSLHNTV